MHCIGYMDWAKTGLLLRESRRQLGLTQAELAKRLGMSRATISQLENGVVAELGMRKLAMVCERLGLEIVVRPRAQRLTLHEAYAKNKEERAAAFRETDTVLAQLNADSKETHG